MARARYLNIEGLDKLVKLYEDMEEEAIKILDDAVKKAIQPVKDTAIQLAPKLTGDLKSKIDIRKEKSKKETKKSWQLYISKSGKLRTKIKAICHEGGTKKMKATPFMRPAIDRNKDKIRNIISEEIIKGIDRALR